MQISRFSKKVKELVLNHLKSHFKMQSEETYKEYADEVENGYFFYALYDKEKLKYRLSKAEMDHFEPFIMLEHKKSGVRLMVSQIGGYRAFYFDPRDEKITLLDSFFKDAIEQVLIEEDFMYEIFNKDDHFEKLKAIYLVMSYKLPNNQYLECCLVPVLIEDKEPSKSERFPIFEYDIDVEGNRLDKYLVVTKEMNLEEMEAKEPLIRYKTKIFTEQKLAEQYIGRRNSSFKE